MPEVELILKADNAQYISKVREAQQVNQELHTSVEKSRKREKGLIEDIEESITKLEAARKKAGTTEDIEKYNKKLAEAKKDLQEYNKAGLETVKTQDKIKKSGDSLSQSIGKWALSIFGLTAALNLLKKAFLATTQGMNAFNIAGAVVKQVLHDIVTGTNLANINILAIIKSQKALNELRVSGYKSLYDVQQLETQYQYFYTQALDQTKTTTERIEAADRALEIFGMKTELQAQRTQKELDAVVIALASAPDNEDLIKAYWALKTELDKIEEDKLTSTRRVEATRSGLIHQGLEDQLNQQKEFQDLSLKLLDDYLQSQIEKLEGTDRLRAQRDFMLKALREQINAMREVGNLTAEQEAMFDEIASDIFKSFEKSIRDMTIPGRVDTEGLTESAEKWIDLFARNLGIESLNAKIGELKPFKGALPTKKTIWDVFGLTEEQGKESLQGLSEVANNLVAVYANITDRMVDEAQRKRELYDTQIAEAQRALELETELFKEGYANNVEAKRREVESLKKLRDEALKDEEKARKAQAAIDTVLQLVNLTTASTEVFKSFSKIPIVGIPLAIAMIGTMFAAFATAKARAASITKLAEGGTGDETGMVTGRSHAAGGERFLDHVEVERGERWGVLNRRASERYGKIFNEMVNSFNKNEMPSFLTPDSVNNITVENSGPNSRLDKVIAEQRRLNDKLGKDTQVLIAGHRKVIKRGNKIRIVG